MEIAKCKSKERCDMGKCKKRATFTISMDSGISGRFYICKGCAMNLAKAILHKSIDKSEIKGE